MKRQPRYPIYIPSKGRAGESQTAKMFDRSGTDYRVVVEPQDIDAYSKVIKRDRLIVLPKNDQGLVYARNFCKDHSIKAGADRHWQFDDDIMVMRRLFKGYRLPVEASIALAIAEDFTDRYENIAITSFNHIGFLPCNGSSQTQWPPFYLNVRCYTCFLVLNSLPNRWRFRYNEDTDMTLQVLADGWCTILFNALHMQTGATNSGGKVTTKKGGQEEVYANDGRLKMARDLERVWPGVVTTRRKFGRPQHKVKDNWRKFDTQLIRRKDIDWEHLEAGGSNDFGMKMNVVLPLQSKDLQRLAEKEKADG